MRAPTTSEPQKQWDGFFGLWVTSKERKRIDPTAIKKKRPYTLIFFKITKLIVSTLSCVQFSPVSLHFAPFFIMNILKPPEPEIWENSTEVGTEKVSPHAKGGRFWPYETDAGKFRRHQTRALWSQSLHLTSMKHALYLVLIRDNQVNYAPHPSM